MPRENYDQRRTYREAIEWIAYNDEPTLLDRMQISELISVCLVSDVFGVEPINVAMDIIHIRNRFK
jgi:hypothetical protein